MAEARDPGQIKPGWTTTEFWQTVFVHAIAAVVALGTVIHTNFNLNGLQAIVPAIALVASAIAQSVYSHSRATVKASAQAAGAQVKSVGEESRGQVAGEPVPIVVRLTGLEPPGRERRG
jgi:DMSO reductase anchor subunit